MSLHHNPRIVTDGLVFAYDMDNAAKSFKGKPTTNLITSTIDNWSGSSLRNATLLNETYKRSAVYRLEVAAGADPATTVDAYYMYNVPNLSEGDVFTFSADVRVIQKSTATSQTSAADNGFWIWYAGSSEHVNFKDLELGKWTNIQVTATVGSTYDYIWARIDHDNSIIDIANIQLEQQPFATPFVNGTRSNTQALLDMSKSKNTVTATSLTYNSDGTFQFNNNNYLSLNTGITGSNFTVLMWHYNGASSFATAGHRTFLSTNNLRVQWDDTPDRGPFVDFNSGSGGGQANFGSSLTPANFLQKYTMVGLVGGSTVKTSFNDVTSGQSSTISGTRNFSSNGNVSIGINNLSGIGGSDHINREGSVVKMPLIQIYDRALTAAEIKQNFNATRGRFGI